jgi:hypothetical protein
VFERKKVLKSVLRKKFVIFMGFNVSFLDFGIGKNLLESPPVSAVQLKLAGATTHAYDNLDGYFGLLRSCIFALQGPRGRYPFARESGRWRDLNLFEYGR